MKKKRTYIRPEIEVIIVDNDKLLAGHSDYEVEAKPNNPDWEDEDEIDNVNDMPGWQSVGYDPNWENL